MKDTTKIRVDFKWVVIGILVVWGEPDLLDALIHWLMQ